MPGSDGLTVWVNLTQRHAGWYQGHPPSLLSPQNPKSTPWSKITWELCGRGHFGSSVETWVYVQCLVHGWETCIFYLGSVFPWLFLTWPRPLRFPCLAASLWGWFALLGWDQNHLILLLLIWGLDTGLHGGREAQGGYAPCPRPQSMEHQGQDWNPGFWFKIQCFSYGARYLPSCCVPDRMAPQAHQATFSLNAFLECIKLKETTKEGRFYYFFLITFI